MDRNTFDHTIRTFKHQKPYRPFTVITVSGNRYEIDHSEAVIVRDGVAMFVAPGGIPHIFDHEGVSEVVGDLSGNTME